MLVLQKNVKNFINDNICLEKKMIFKGNDHSDFWYLSCDMFDYKDDLNRKLAQIQTAGDTRRVQTQSRLFFYDIIIFQKNYGMFSGINNFKVCEHVWLNISILMVRFANKRITLEVKT